LEKGDFFGGDWGVGIGFTFSIKSAIIPPMKDSLAHLPQRKRGELARIVSIIRESVPQAEMIILFGSYARGDAVEDRL